MLELKLWTASQRAPLKTQPCTASGTTGNPGIKEPESTGLSGEEGGASSTEHWASLMEDGIAPTCKRPWWHWGNPWTDDSIQVFDYVLTEQFRLPKSLANLSLAKFKTENKSLARLARLARPVFRYNNLSNHIATN